LKVIKIPFSFTDGGVAETTDILKATEQKIIDNLTTRTGERAINTNYGLGIQNLLYEMVNPLVFDDFKTDAIIRLNNELDSGKVLDMSISYPNSPEMAFVEDSVISVNIVYSMPMNGTRTLTFNVTSDI
jgi:hypothetical protein